MLLSIRSFFLPFFLFFLICYNFNYVNMDCDICYETFFDTTRFFTSKRCSHSWCIDCHKVMIRKYSRNFPCPFCRTPIRKPKQKNPFKILPILYDYPYEYDLDTCYCNITGTIRPCRIRRSVLKQIRSARQQ